MSPLQFTIFCASAWYAFVRRPGQASLVPRVASPRLLRARPNRIQFHITHDMQRVCFIHSAGIKAHEGNGLQYIQAIVGLSSLTFLCPV